MSVGGEERATLGHGDYFGEIALIDDDAEVPDAGPRREFRLGQWYGAELTS